MWNRIIVAPILASLTILAANWPAAAKTVDTFDFTDSSDWFEISAGVAVPADITVTGSFTGTVEADSHIEQADLANFFVSGLIDFTKVDLILFSYDTIGGASSLDIIAQASLNTYMCVGASATLSMTCNPLGENPFNARAVFAVGSSGAFAYTTDFPKITLVSTITSIPEPSTWAMLAVGFAAIGLARARRPFRCGLRLS
jgi:hypothetical protein